MWTGKCGQKNVGKKMWTEKCGQKKRQKKYRADCSRKARYNFIHTSNKNNV